VERRFLRRRLMGGRANCARNPPLSIVLMAVAGGHAQRPGLPRLPSATNGRPPSMKVVRRDILVLAVGYKTEFCNVIVSGVFKRRQQANE
jgi:hypothetical protein